MAYEDVWMVTHMSDEMLEKKSITVDCSGPDGNAFGLLALAEDIGRQMGWDDSCLLYTSPSPRDS